jgi:hypothetical protein
LQRGCECWSPPTPTHPGCAGGGVKFIGAWGCGVGLKRVGGRRGGGGRTVGGGRVGYEFHFRQCCDGAIGRCDWDEIGAEGGLDQALSPADAGSDGQMRLRGWKGDKERGGQFSSRGHRAHP